MNGGSWDFRCGACACTGRATFICAGGFGKGTLVTTAKARVFGACGHWILGTDGGGGDRLLGTDGGGGDRLLGTDGGDWWLLGTDGGGGDWLLGTDGRGGDGAASVFPVIIGT